MRLLWCSFVVACASASSAPLSGSGGSEGSDGSLAGVGVAAVVNGVGIVVPWAVVQPTDEPPTLKQRHALADAACPKVAAPFFYRV